MDTIEQGHDLFVFIDESNSGTTPQWVPVAFAKQHTLKKSSETKERQHKDLTDPTCPEVAVTKVKTTISCSGLVGIPTGDQGNVTNFDKLEAKMDAKQPVKLKYGKKNAASGTKYRTGMFIISDLERDDQVGEDSTYSATFEASGAITTTAETGSSGGGDGEH